MPRGRVSIFEKNGPKVQGIISLEGARRFELARTRLAQLAGWQERTVSDADTIEFLARGEHNAVAYLKQKAG